jgi:mannosyl-3-phosphoglycerate phosphatase
MSYIIFTDLDGTLLDHHNYSYDDALPIIEKIKAKNIPLIFTTSKTKQECEILQNKMGIDMPFIVENGAAIYGLDEVVVLGLRVEIIREFLEQFKEKFGIKAFYDMSVEEVMQKTGFDKTNALLSKQREFSEPFLMEDESRIVELKRVAKKSGLKVLKGGRFYHLVGQDQDKGRAVLKVLQMMGLDKRSIALGDNYNDLDMLRVVDQPVLIPYKEGEYIKTDIKNLIKAPHTGSKGWAEVLGEIIE